MVNRGKYAVNHRRGSGNFSVAVSYPLTGCTRISPPVNVTVKPNSGIAAVAAVPATICLGTTTTLEANGVAGTNAVVTWFSGPNASGTMFGAGPILANVGEGTYYARVTSDCGVPGEASIAISRESVSTIFNQSICQGQSYGGHRTDGTYIEKFTSVNGCDSIRILNLVVTPAVSSTVSRTICAGQNYEGYSPDGTYTNTFAAANGCDSISVLHLTVLQKPIPDLGLDRGICEGDTVIIYPGPFQTYLWQDASTSDHFIVRDAGKYSVSVTNGCGTGSDEITLLKKNCGIYFSDDFTPDNDGKNDVFRILNTYYLKDYCLTVYNRWGQKVFETKDYTRGWDGKCDGQLQNQGVYVWFCRYKKNSVVSNLKGTLVLVR
jgi:gliding motility-associated-like protein